MFGLPIPGLSSVKLWLAGGALLALAAAGGAWALQVRGLRADIAEQRVKTAEAETALEVERGNVARLEAALARQNAAVDAMRDAAAAVEGTATATARGVLAASAERRKAIQAAPGTGPQEMNRWFGQLLAR